MSREAQRLGATLGLFMVYGRDTVQDALNALAQGKASSTQQRIAYELIEALTSGKVSI